MGLCPGCGAEIPEDKFLCNICAKAVPDPRMERIGEAIDSNDTQLAEDQIAQAVADLNG